MFCQCTIVYKLVIVFLFLCYAILCIAFTDSDDCSKGEFNDKRTAAKD